MNKQRKPTSRERRMGQEFREKWRGGCWRRSPYILQKQKQAKPILQVAFILDDSSVNFDPQVPLQ